jgi:hypothetical protein
MSSDLEMWVNKSVFIIWKNGTETEQVPKINFCQITFKFFSALAYNYITSIQCEKKDDNIMIASTY